MDFEGRKIVEPPAVLERIADDGQQLARSGDDRLFAAQWLAYALPYRRFTGALAGVNARLGANVDRYSFIAVDFHHLLFAGFYRRNKNPETCNITGSRNFATTSQQLPSQSGVLYVNLGYRESLGE